MWIVINERELVCMRGTYEACYAWLDKCGHRDTEYELIEIGKHSRVSWEYTMKKVRA